MASNVPKFSSFRPKSRTEPRQPPTQERSPKDDSHGKPADRDNQERRRKSHRSSRDREDDLRARSERRHRADRQNEHVKEDLTIRQGKGHHSIRTASLESDVPRMGQTRKTAADLPYFIDRRGDPDILNYGTLNTYDTPPYRRYGYGALLGLPTYVKIDRINSSDKALYVVDATYRRQERRLLSKRQKEPNRLLRVVKAGPDGDQHTADYIPLSKTDKRKRDHSSDSDGADYRAIDSERHRSPSADLDYEPGGNEDAHVAELKATNSELIRRTRDHPEDVKAWVSLVEHQDAMMALDRSTANLTTSDRVHLADVRIHMYEQAIRKSGSNEENMIQLYLGLMTEALRSWDSTRLSKKWDDILTKFPHSLDLWIKYLDFKQNDFGSFKYENCKVAFGRCLRTLITTNKSTPPESLVHVMLRLTSMIRDSGYREIALSIWQALLEFHIYRPVDLSGKSIAECLESFEEFWDSEVPRIGEPNAKGWCNCVLNGSMPVLAEPQTLRRPAGSPSLNTFGEDETEHITNLYFAGRTTHEVGEDDPFHTIFFADVAEYLQLMPQNIPGTLLLDAFLYFLGLPPLCPSQLYHAVWLRDPYLHFRNPNSQLDTFQSGNLAQAMRTFMQGSMSVQMTTELLFDCGFRSIHQTSTALVAQRTLKLMASDTTQVDAIGEYLLALELHIFPSEVFKTAKELLKANPSSLRLYNAYGLVESGRGKTEKSQQVFEAALSMQSESRPLATLDSLHLFSNWVWEGARSGSAADTLWRLVSPRGQVPQQSAEEPDQAAILRARALFQEGNDRASLANDYQSATLFTSLLALLAYILEDKKAEAGLTHFERLSDWLLAHRMSHGPAAELLAQAVAHFLMHHVSHAPIVKPALLRMTLDPLIIRFPTNTLLLSLYAANEIRFSIEGRVRDTLQQRVLGNGRENSIFGWFFAIRYEMLRGEIAGSTSHSIRALFKKAEDDIGAHCPALWISHVLFELDEATKERARRPSKKQRHEGKGPKNETRLEEHYRRVKETFFQGLTSLPWCKDYMMLAFTHLYDQILTTEELRRVYNVMVEKELRLFVELDAN